MPEKPQLAPDPRRSSIGSELKKNLTPDMRRHLGEDPEGAIDAADIETKQLWRQYQNLLQDGFLLLTDLKNGQSKNEPEIRHWVKKEKAYCQLINERREAAKAAGAPTAMHNLLSNTSSGLLLSLEYALLHEEEIDEIWREVAESGQLPDQS